MCIRLLTLVCLAAGGLIVTTSAQRVPDYRDPAFTYEEGWTTLFNGRDLKGWVVALRMEDRSSKRYLPENQSVFSVKEDGVLAATGEPRGYIRPVQIFDNYVFHVELRYPPMTEDGPRTIRNSGVLVHCQRDEVWPQGIECQGYQGHMGRIFPLRNSTLVGGEMIHDAARPIGEWNTYEVYSEEGRLATIINGKLVGLASGADPRAGFICLQSEGTPVEYRNIKIRRFTPAHHFRSRPRTESGVDRLLLPGLDRFPILSWAADSQGLESFGGPG